MAVQRGVEGHPQFAVIVVSHGHESEWLQAGALELARGPQHFGHAHDWSDPGMEGDLHKIAAGKLFLELQQAAGNREGLELCARPEAGFDHYGGGNGTVELKTGGAPMGVGLGEVGHIQLEYAIARSGQGRLPKVHPWAYPSQRKPAVCLLRFAIITAVTFRAPIPRISLADTQAEIGGRGEGFEMRSHKSCFCCTVVALGLLALLSGCSRDPNVRKQKYMESGQRYYDKGQYREAAIQFQNAIQVDQQFAEAHYRMGLTALKLQQWPGAYQELSTAIQDNPEHYAARLELAKLQIAAREYAGAKDQLDVLVQKQPNNAEVYLALASYYSTGTKDIPAALRALSTALQKDPSSSDAYLNLGLLQFQDQQWANAETSLKKAVDLSAPTSPDALLALGNFYQTRGRFPEAEQAFRRAIQNVPTEPNARLALGGLLLAENKSGEAEELMRQSKKDFPDNSSGYSMLGNFYISVNQMDKALAEYASLYQDHPKDLVVKKNYIQLLILRDKLGDAGKLTDEVIKAQPTDVDAQIYKAEIQIRSGKGNDASNTLQEVLKNDPSNAVAHYQLGLALEEVGNSTRAENEWREAVRLRPDIIEAHRALAGAAIRRGDPSLLAQEADQIIELQPGSSDGYMFRGVADMDRRDYASADQFLRQSIEKEPINPAAYVQVGNLRSAQNQMAEAQKAYQTALDQDPNSEDALGGVLNVFIVQKQPDKAMAALKAHLAKYPNNSAFHSMLGDLLKEQNDRAAAEAEYRRAIDLDKKNGPALVKLGMVQNERGETDAALQTYLGAARDNPKEVGFALLAGAIYENRQDWSNAKQMYQKVLANQPDNPVASNNLAYVMLQQGGNVDVAFAMAQTARRQLPDNANTADTLGWAFYNKRVYTSAINLLKEAVKKEPENPRYVSHLGMAYARSGQVALARQQLDRIERLKPNSSEAEDLKRALAEAKGQG